MNQFARWVWPGIFTVGVLSFLAIWLTKDAIEADLSTRTAHALEQSGAKWVDIDINGRDVVLSGSAYNDGLRADADTTARALYGVRVVDSRSELVALQAPYTLRADLSTDDTGQTYRLEGFVPDEATRRRLVERVKASFPGAKVVDNLAYARGASDHFADYAIFAVQQLKGLKEGNISLSDDDFSIEGQGETAKTYDAALASVTNNRPPGVNLKSQAISPPAVSPYIWSVAKAEDGVVITGYLPSATDAQQTREAVGQRFQPLSVDDQATIAEGAPEGFRSYQSYALDVLGTLSSGNATLTDNALVVEGSAKDIAAYEAAQNLLSGGKPAGLSIERVSIAAPTVSPYTWSLRRAGSVMTMSGHVISEKDRQALVDAVKTAFPSMKLDDRTHIAIGAPQETATARGAAIGALGRLSDGTVDFSDGVVSIRGMAQDSTAYSAVQSHLASALPTSHKLVVAEIAPPQANGAYVFRAEKQDSGVMLNGTVPDTATRDTLLQVASSSGGESVIETLEFAAGAPAQFDAAAQYALQGLASLQSGSATVSEQTITFEGRAASHDAYEALTGSGSTETPDGYQVSAEAIHPPMISPYTWSAKTQNDTLLLSGFVPDRETRDDLEEAARSTGVESINNQLRIADGAPAGFASVVKQTLALASSLRSFEASVADRDLSLQGEAESETEKNRMETALRTSLSGSAMALQSRITVLEQVEEPQPVVEKPAQMQSTEAADVVSPVVSMEDEVAAEVTEPDIETADTEPQTEPSPVQPQVSTSDAGPVNQPDNQPVSQQQKHADASEPTEGRSEDDVPSATDKPQPTPMVQVASQTTPAQPSAAPPACPTDFSKLLENKRIQFATDRAAIKDESFGLLDRIAMDLAECDNKRIEISGHTDSRGEKAYNLQLSKERAEAVKDYLTRKGVGTNQLLAKGYGETRPRAPNDTPENLALNRRIEFNLLP